MKPILIGPNGRIAEREPGGERLLGVLPGLMDLAGQHSVRVIRIRGDRLANP